MDFNKEVNKKTNEIIEQKLPAMIEDKIGKMLDSILEDVFRSYSDTSKQIKEVIEQKLNINLQKFDLVDYNTMISNAINSKLIQHINDVSVEPILKLVEKTIGFVSKKEIKLSEIHEMIIENIINDDSNDEEGKISFYCIKNEEHKWYTICIDLEADKDPKECEIEFLISSDEKRGTIFLFKAKSSWSKKRNVDPMLLTQLDEIQHQIFRLYAAQVKVIIDEENFHNEWTKYDY